MKKVKKTLWEHWGRNEVQMGHVWGIHTLAYFHAIGKLLKPFSPTPTKPNAPQSFFIGNGA